MTARTIKANLALSQDRDRLGGLAVRLRLLGRALRRWHDSQMALAELSRLDDRALRDIGIERRELRDLVEARLQERDRARQFASLV
ncbi:MAG TPA: DUF1127 domain-containing protein [Dongiaceae bacterium]|nr:DUF1127 domain-containing protein [Dongiaceae bacterium]